MNCVTFFMTFIGSFLEWGWYSGKAHRPASLADELADDAAAEPWGTSLVQTAGAVRLQRRANGRTFGPRADRQERR
jgi:hypothetical protein